MVWIDTDRGAAAIKHLRWVAHKKMEEEEALASAIAKANSDWYREMHREVECEHIEEKREGGGEGMEA